MKYFTRELIEMGQSRDHAVLNRQEELWDEACERYFSQLDALKPEMPPGLRRILDGYYLHDAVVQGMGQQGRTFLIVLQLDTPPHSLLAVTYDLVAEPALETAALSPEDGTGVRTVEWQYDEIERVASEPPTWRQSILLSNGWEVQLNFREVQVQEVQTLIPVPRNGSTADSTPSRVHSP